MCTSREWFMGTSRGYVFETQGHSQCLTDIFKANILIDKAGHVRLADFGLLTIISATIDLTISSSSFTQGGTHRWMGPELFPAGRFDPEHNSPTKSSDCYALGMVIYEVLSGKVPFYDYNYRMVVANALGDLKEWREHGSRMIFGVSWRVAGNPPRATDHGSRMSSSVWRKPQGLGRHLFRTGNVLSDVEG